MTDDDFTRAAEDAAEEQWTREHTPGHPLSGPERMNRRIGFTAGAEWARDHLAAQEPTDAEAIAYLAAFVEDLPPGEDADWTPDTIARVKRGLRAARRDEEKR